MKNILNLIILIIGFSALAQNNPKGQDLIIAERLKFISANPDYGKVEKMNVGTDSLELLFKTEKEPKFIHNLSSNFHITKSDYKKGRVFLLSFQAKTVTSSLETGEAKALFIFKQLDNYQGNIASTQTFSSNWQTYYIPFETNRYVKKEDLGIVMQFGFREQSFLLKNLKFESFPEGTAFEDLPKTEITYAGMEADAQWRTEANKRIEAIRTGQFQLHLTKNGTVVPNKKIHIKLIKHSFPFGAALNAKDVVEDNSKYKNFKKAFNLAVFENDLKIKSWEKPKSRQATLDAITQLRSDAIHVKGHVLIWPGFRYLTPKIKENKDDPEKVKSLMHEHVTNVLTLTKGQISNWDVVNEAYTNKDLQTITGSEDILYEGFKSAKALQPQARRFTNEYGIISKGGLDTQKQQWYYDFIKRIDENTNGLVQGIGIQSHIGSDLTPPERVLEILAFYATLGKQISISEFTMDIQEPKIREQYTRDFMIAAFSHPNVSEFLFWGYTENAKKKVDIFKENGDIGAMGKAYFSLVDGAWKTDLNAVTDANGNLKAKGFYGEYEYAFVENGKVVTGTFLVQPRHQNFIKIEL
ncbi:endo-1,4-beta-xylanase [Pseudotamlana agarivorans]|uniref:endo-1,4-beta-xylanase n=1 Tax=Pseudotamlana agarivorans TaxID=481183 RepID=UPI000829FEFA|nr:endo-1,4-beta-xylanase [Tamlana agarivorans]